MADTADHLSPAPVLIDTIADSLEGADLQAVQATMSMVTGEVSDGSTDQESSLQASAPATSLPAIPENPDDLLSTPQATAQLQNIITFSNGPSSPVQDDQNFDTPRPSDPEPAPEAAEDQLRETSRQKLFQPSALDVFSASGGGSAMAKLPHSGPSPRIANRQVPIQAPAQAAAISEAQAAIQATSERVTGLAAELNRMQAEQQIGNQMLAQIVKLVSAPAGSAPGSTATPSATLVSAASNSDNIAPSLGPVHEDVPNERGHQTGNAMPAAAIHAKPQAEMTPVTATDDNNDLNTSVSMQMDGGSMKEVSAKPEQHLPGQHTVSEQRTAPFAKSPRLDAAPETAIHAETDHVNAHGSWRHL